MKSISVITATECVAVKNSIQQSYTDRGSNFGVMSGVIIDITGRVVFAGVCIAAMSPVC